MRLVQECVVERLSEWNRRPGVSRFNVFVSSTDSSGWDEDTWADMIRADVQQRTLLEVPAGLREYVSVPEIAASMVLVDTAIRAVVHALIARGRSRTAALAEIRAECPDWDEAITTAEVLSSLLGSGRDTPIATSKLPRRLGSLGRDEQPRYELIHRIGAGSHASVYRAIDHELGTPERPAWVAVKLLRSESDHVPLRALLAEAERARHVAHPCVIPVYDAGCTAHGEVYIVTPVFESRTFADHHHERDAKRVRSVVAAVQDVCEGLQAVHNAGMLHCDIKPQNILMDAHGRARIADFGMSVWTEHEEDSDDSRGTLGFMAPEQRARSVGWRRPAVDTYAAGATLAWALTGRVLHGSTAEEAERVLSDDASHAVAVRTQLASIKDPELRMIVARAVEFDPHKRYTTPQAFGSDLRAWLAGEPVEWMRLGLRRRSALWVRRAPMQVLASSATLVAMGTILASVLWMRAESYAAALGLSNERAASSQAQLTQAKSIYGTLLKVNPEFGKPVWRDNYMPSMALIDAVFGPVFFDSSGVSDELWKIRIDEAKRNQVGLPPDSVNYLNWRLLEGIWLLQLSRNEEAMPALESAVAGWASVCRPNDPWLREVEAVRNAGKVLLVAEQREAAFAKGTQRPTIEGPELEAIEASLCRIETESTPIRRVYYLATRALRALDGPLWRNRPERVKAIDEGWARKRGE